MATTQTIKTLGKPVVGTNGYETYYISFKDLIARDSVALSSTPTVASSNTNVFVVTDEALNVSSQTINSITHAAGEVLIFKADSTGKTVTDAEVIVEINYQTTKTKSCEKYKICRRSC